MAPSVPTKVTDMKTDHGWTDSPVRFCSVPWAEHCTPEIWHCRLKNINTKMAQVMGSDQNSTEFYQTQMAMMIVEINRMEGTVSPTLREEEMFTAILKFLDDSCQEPEVVGWNAEGGHSCNIAASERQLYQMTRAAVYLLRDNANAPLSLELIKSTYRTMMEHSYEDDKRGNRTKLQVDDVRKSQVYAGSYVFAPAAAVTNSVLLLCREYNHERLSMHPVCRATYLFYELITIHPFSNGNGRLCRYFLTWSLMRDGFPFPVSFSSGHTKRRQHNLHAINRARLEPYRSRGELNAILVVSLERVLSNYADIQRHLRNASNWEQDKPYEASKEDS